MSATPALTPVADAGRDMPAGSSARLDLANAAVASLRGEQRRLERLGLETPLARCQHQLRFWSFVRAVVSLEPEPRA